MSKLFHAPFHDLALQRVTFASALSLAAVLALGACGKADDGQTAGQKLDSALEKTAKAGAQAKVNTESAMADAGAALKDAVQKGEASTQTIASKIEEKFDDLSITTAVKAGLAKNTDLSALKISVETKNGVVLLKGMAPTAAAKDRASDIAKAVKGVTTVDNQLTISSN